MQARVFLGELGVAVDGQTLTGSSPVTTFSPLLGAEILVGTPGSDPEADKSPADDAPRRTITLTLNPEYEHGFVVDTAPAGASGTEIVTGGALAAGQDAGPGHPRFGGVVLLPGEYEEKPRTSVIPAPDLPNARLKLRGD